MSKFGRTLAILLLSVSGPATGGPAVQGYVVGWGFNASGQATGVPSHGPTGNPSRDWRSLFSTGTVSIAGQTLTNAVVVAAMPWTSLALCNDGTVVGWGDDTLGQATGTPMSPHGSSSGRVTIFGGVVSNAVAITAGRDHAMALLRNGRVVAWGENQSGETAVPLGLKNVVKIAAGGWRSYAVDREGKLWTWAGTNRWPYLPGSGELTNVTDVSASWEDCPDVALKKDGTVVEWWPHNGQILPVQGLTNVVAVSAGLEHRLALLKDGTVFAWGRNTFGEVTGTHSAETNGLVQIDGKLLTDVKAIVAGQHFSLALRKDGTVVGWGSADMGRNTVTVPAGLSDVQAIAAGDQCCLALTTNKAVADRFRQ